MSDDNDKNKKTRFLDSAMKTILLSLPVLGVIDFLYTGSQLHLFLSFCVFLWSFVFYLHVSMIKI